VHPPRTCPAAQVSANRRCDAATDELRQELQRTALREEHYTQQGDDAAKLTAENRLLIGRVEEMGFAVEQHKAELDRLQQENASLHAKTQLMEERTELLKKLRKRESEALRLLDQAKAELDESDIFA
jgi:predicted RNase H-like nuclease (RuvC/YqgF family)